MRIKESGGPGLHQFPCKPLSVRGEGGDAGRVDEKEGR